MRNTHRHRSILLPAIYCLAGFLLSHAATLAGNLGDYLPAGKAQGHFMKETFPPRANELLNKMQEALKQSQNKQWFADALKKSKPGEPLPYDERIGLTPAEYQEFLLLAKQKGLEEVLTRDIQVIHNSDNSISLDAGDDLKVLSAIKFDPAKNTITTPYGSLGQPDQVDASGEGEGGVFGPYMGITFHGGQADSDAPVESMSGKAMEITLGKIIKTGRRFIYYHVIVIEKGKRTTGIDMFLEY